MKVGQPQHIQFSDTTQNGNVSKTIQMQIIVLEPYSSALGFIPFLIKTIKVNKNKKLLIKGGPGKWQVVANVSATSFFLSCSLVLW